MARILAAFLLALLIFNPFVKSQNVSGEGSPGIAALSGITASMGGSLLSVGVPITSTVTVAGASTNMVCVMDPSPGNTLIASIIADCYVSSANTVTTRLTGLIVGLTPAAQTYIIRVIQ